tara:strand:- start:875 stop:1303 length:429 start_codon:yes stop_codon:yes gene_type:complete
VANDINGIVDEIYTILNDTGQFNDVYKFAVKDIDTTPLATIYWNGIDSYEPAETVSRWATYQFIIDMFFSMEGEKGWQDNQKTIIFAVLDAFLDKPDLDMPNYVITQIRLSPVQNNIVTIMNNPYAHSEFSLFVQCFEEATT